MRIKVGNKWYECKPDKPIMVELTTQDKFNIAHMSAEATKYACFDDNDKTTKREKLEWMQK